MKASIEHKIKAIAARVGHPDWKEDEPRYRVGSHYNGGFAETFTLQDALDTAAEMTSDEVSNPFPVLLVTNEYNNVICLFCDGNAYLDARAMEETQ